MTTYYNIMPPPVELKSKIVVLDLGSFEGFSPIWDELKDKVELIGIDPFEPEGVRYGKFNRKETTFNCIIGDKNQSNVDFHVSRNKHASSLLKGNKKVVSRYHTEYDGEILSVDKVEVKEIKELLSNQNINEFDFLKIDIEGMELNIMKNLENILKNNCLGIFAECFFQEYYVGQPLFSEIELFLRNLGYHVFDLQIERWGRKNNPQKYHNGQVMFANTLFLKDPILTNDIEDIEKIKKLSMLAELWKQKDFADELKTHYNIW